MNMKRKAILKVKKFCEEKELFTARKKIIVATSGGPDSMLLLSLLNEWRNEYGFDIIAVHLNHMFRGEEAVRDAEFVREFCLQRGIEHRIASEDVVGRMQREKLTAQAAGHKARRELFAQVAMEWQADTIALAHHADDRAETVLLHLLHGSGLDGLAALKARDGMLIRPLLCLEKTEILHLCSAEGIPYTLDPSNEKPVYKRNRIRLELIPYLQEYNPAISSALFRLAELAEDEQVVMESLVAALSGKTWFPDENPVRISLVEFAALERALQRRTIRAAYCAAVRARELSFRHVEAVCELLLKQGPGTLDLPHGIKLEKGYTDALFSAQAKETDRVPEFSYPLSAGEIYIKELNLYLEVEMFNEKPPTPPLESGCVLGLRTDTEELRLRNRRNGDRLASMSKGKKLKELLIDKKIERAKRDGLLLLTRGDEVLWVRGLHAYKPSGTDTKNGPFLRIKIRENGSLQAENENRQNN